MASQTSDVGSIPIARSINPIDSNTFTGLIPLKTDLKHPGLGRSWTRLCCKMVQLDAATEWKPLPILLYGEWGRSLIRSETQS